jgi:FKBP-type peptidyl-prolyl cis-trans isomerase
MGMDKRLIMRFFLLISLIFFFSCNRQKQEGKKTVVKQSKESLEEINRLLVNKDAELIESYVKRHNWNMNTTETGLWYMIYENSEGVKIKEGDFVTYNYETRLLDGTLCYSSESLGAKSIIAGQGGIESGLEEGLLLLNKGSKARFVLPPHLAHGLIGDENRIPARAILIYDIEILEIKNLNTQSK